MQDARRSVPTQGEFRQLGEFQQAQTGRASLLFRLSGHLCALPLFQVVETLRPLPVTVLADAPALVDGLTVIRGESLPVIDLGPLFEREPTAASRFIVLKSASRRFALKAEEVLGVYTLESGWCEDLPPLLDHSKRRGIEAIAHLDTEFTFILDGAKLVPEALWRALKERE